MEDAKWLTFYTKSRHEEKVRDQLHRKGYEVFLPMQYVVRQWSDRKKKIKVPLFNSYIFVNDVEKNIPQIIQTPGIAWNVRHDDKPAILHAREFEIINRFIETGLFIDTLANVSNDLKENDFVEVIEVPLKGIKGKLIQTLDGDKFSVTLSALGSSMLIKLDSRLLRKGMIF